MPAPKKIDIAKAVKLRNKGMSIRDIAKTQGVAHTSLIAALKPLKIELPSESDQERITRQITPLIEYNLHKTLAQMTTTEDAKEFKDRAIALGILNQNHRLNTGQSTQNIASIMAKMALEADEMDSKTVDNS